MNRVDIFFDTCSPAPSRGYKLWWRVAGSSDPYTNGGHFFISPATFFDSDNPPGTEYEGVLISDCGGISGGSIHWSTIAGGESGDSGSGGGGHGDPFNVMAHIVNCGSTLALQISDIKFNGITIPPISGSSYPVNVDEYKYFALSNFAHSGELRIFLSNNTSGETVRVITNDSSHNPFCFYGIGAAEAVFPGFDMDSIGGSYPVVINIDCGVCE